MILIPQLFLQSRQEGAGSQQAEIRVFDHVVSELKPEEASDEMFHIPPGGRTGFSDGDDAAGLCACTSRSVFRDDADA